MIRTAEGFGAWGGFTDEKRTLSFDRQTFAMLNNLSRLKEERAQRWSGRLQRVWRTLDHPDGKLGLTFTFNHQKVTLLNSMSPKKTTISLLLLSSSAFVIGTSIGLGAFCWMFDITREVQICVLYAALIGMMLTYLLVLLTIVHLVFYRDARAKGERKHHLKSNENASNSRQDDDTSARRRHIHKSKGSAAASS